MAGGNATELVKIDDVLVARSLYEAFEDERLPVSLLLPALIEWRDLVLARGGVRDLPESQRRNPIPMNGPDRGRPSR